MHAFIIIPTVCHLLLADSGNDWMPLLDILDATRQQLGKSCMSDGHLKDENCKLLASWITGCSFPYCLFGSGQGSGPGYIWHHKNNLSHVFVFAHIHWCMCVHVCVCS